MPRDRTQRTTHGWRHTTKQSSLQAHWDANTSPAATRLHKQCVLADARRLQLSTVHTHDALFTREEAPDPPPRSIACESKGFGLSIPCIMVTRPCTASRHVNQRPTDPHTCFAAGCGGCGTTTQATTVVLPWWSTDAGSCRVKTACNRSRWRDSTTTMVISFMSSKRFVVVSLFYKIISAFDEYTRDVLRPA